MPDTPLTPEEKLLRIIEAPATPGMRPMAQRRPQDIKLTLKLLRAKYEAWFKEKGKDFLNLKTFNYVLMALSLAATVFVGIDFYAGLPKANALAAIEAEGRKTGIGDLGIELLPPVSDYVTEITQRNFFALPESPQVTAAAQAAATQAAAPAFNPAEGLKVVGIIWSDAPQVIIEDPKDNRTHLLYRNSKIRGGRVKEILKDRVILSYDNQDIEVQ